MMSDDLVKRLRTENALAGYYGPPAIQVEAADRIAALEERLEIKHAYQLVNGKLVRVEADMSDCDGIAARDETIRLQDQRIAALEAALRELLHQLDTDDVGGLVEGAMAAATRALEKKHD